MLQDPYICGGQTPFLQTGIKGHSGKELRWSQELEEEIFIVTKNKLGYLRGL